MSVFILGRKQYRLEIIQPTVIHLITSYSNPKRPMYISVQPTAIVYIFFNRNALVVA